MTKNFEFKIKTQFLDNPIYINSIFEGYEKLASIKYLSNFNSKYLTKIDSLFF